MRNININGAKFIAHTWGPRSQSHRVTERRGFKTIEGAHDFAAGQSAHPDIIEVSITVKDKSKGTGAVRRLATYKKGRQT